MTIKLEMSDHQPDGLFGMWTLRHGRPGGGAGGEGLVGGMDGNGH